MKHNLSAGIIAAIVMAIVLWTIAYSGNLDAQSPNIEVRKINTVTLPPPPPPVVLRQQSKAVEAVNLKLISSPQSVQLKVSPLAVKLPKLALPEQELSQTFELAPTVSTEGLAKTLTTFALDELDQLPQLLSRLHLKLPSSLRRQGLTTAQLVLHIIIHESGKVELVAIDRLPYSELRPLVTDLIRQARFSAPIRHGKKVKAEFLWPVNINA